jgi:ABC-type uncharacterized transport system substrate-binding protein
VLVKITSLVAALFLGATSLGASAQQPRSVTIGWLGSGSVDKVRQDAFERSLRDHRLAPRLEIRFAQAKLDQLPALAADLVRLKPDLILAADAVSTTAAKKASDSIPIVMAGASDPVGLGLVRSLARPGGNVTGLSSPFGGEFAGKWVELARQRRGSATSRCARPPGTSASSLSRSRFANSATSTVPSRIINAAGPTPWWWITHRS